MSEVVDEWISKAEGDYRVAARELAVTGEGSFDAVCFHTQQCVEKLLKANLILRQVLPPKTHDLADLSRVLSCICSDWDWPLPDLRRLSQSAVDVRYPGVFADRTEAEQAFTICTNLRERLRALLGCPA
jgi:HEPN domain-containing protein